MDDPLRPTEGDPRPCPIHDEPPPAGGSGGDRASALAQHEASSSPAASSYDPREARGGSTSGVPTPNPSPGGRHPKTHLILGAIETQVEEIILVLAGTDYRASADMLEEIAWHLQEASEQDRRKAKAQRTQSK